MDKLIKHNDTITAISTPVGSGGIAVVRVSGPEAIQLSDRVFRGRRALGECASHTAHFGRLVSESGALLDEVVATLFRAPNSYTGEDTVEFSCHGGQYVAQRVLQELLACGARLAEPGEFTKRAFLNGRIDLSQAEAIADLISAQTDRAHRISLAQLEGRLSEKIKGLREELINILGLLELELDFAEEGIELVERNRVSSMIDKALASISELLKSFEIGRIYKEGVNVVLAGMPNVGKSSLLNTLLDEDRAIVTPIPGTTRDVIEESIAIDGILFRFTDTAGVRETQDPVEREGVARTNRKIQQADVVVAVLDAGVGIRDEESALIQSLREKGKKVIPVLNKIDLFPGNHPPEMEVVGERAIPISALKRIGIDELKRQLVCLAAGGGNGSTESVIVVSNIRHAKALEKARVSLLAAKESINEGRSSEFIAVDLRASLDSLGEIIGVVTTDDILNAIFSKFCIGK